MKELKIVITILLLSFSVNGLAIQDVVDSLRNIVDSEIHDSIKLKAFGELGVKYETIDFDSALYFYSQAIALSEAQHLLSEKAKVLVSVGFAYYYTKNDSEKLFDYFRQGIELYKQANDKAGEMNTLYNMGYFYGSLENFAKAIESFGNAASIATELDNKQRLSEIHNNLGLMYQYSGKYAKAIENQIDGLTLKEAIGDDSISVAFSYLNIGVNYNTIKNSSKAIEYFAKALTLINGKHIRADAICYNGLGEAYNNLGDTVKTLNNYKKAFNNYVLLNDSNGMARYFLRLGNYYSEYNTEKALLKYQKALNIFPEKGSPKLEASILSSLSTLKLAQYLENKQVSYLQACLVSADKMHKIGNRIGAKDHINKSAELLFRANKLIGNNDEAVKYADIYILTKDSLIGKEIVNATLELQTKYETEKVESENEKLKTENLLKEQPLKFWNVIMIAISSVLGLILILLVSIIRNSRKMKAANALLNEQKEELVTQAENLRELDEFKQSMTGMLVHDMKNPLNTILNLSRQKSNDFSSSNINKSAYLMLTLVSNILDTQRFEEAKFQLDKTDSNLLEIVDRSIQTTQLLADDKNIEINMQIDKNAIVLADVDVIIRVFENLFTNAIKYTPVNGNIIVSSRQTAMRGGQLAVTKPELPADSQLQTADYVKITVSDTGEGIAEEKIPYIFEKFGQVQAKDSGTIRSTGLGLTFCKMAIEAHGGEIGVESDKITGATFWFTLPLSNKKRNEILQSELPETVKDKKEFVLTIDGKKYLLQFTSKLSKTSIYQTSVIRSILSEIDEEESEIIKIWKDEIVKSLYNCNEEKYQELLQVVNGE